MATIFVSHSDKDRVWVREHVVDPLRAAGHAPFFSGESLQGGDDFLSEINKGLDQSDRLLVVVSSRSVASPWVRNEVEAWFDEHGDNNPIPVLMEPLKARNLHVRLACCNAIDLSDPNTRPQNTGKLLNALAGLPGAKGPEPAPGIEIDRTRTDLLNDRPSAWRTIAEAVARPALKSSKWTVLVLDAGNGRPMPGVPVRLRREAGKSVAGQVMSWLGTQRGTTGLDGKVIFMTENMESMVEVSIEDSARYRQMPPKPGFQPPSGINSVIFVARKN